MRTVVVLVVSVVLLAGCGESREESARREAELYVAADYTGFDDTTTEAVGRVVIDRDCAAVKVMGPNADDETGQVVFLREVQGEWVGQDFGTFRLDDLDADGLDCH